MKRFVYPITRSQNCLSSESRIVDPEDLNKVCEFVQQYQPQSPHFNHVHHQTVVRRRRRAVSPDECAPQSNTAFCQATKTHRDAVVETVWTEVSRKHLYRKESEVRLALEGCLGVCGTCLAGNLEGTKYFISIWLHHYFYYFLILVCNLAQ